MGKEREMKFLVDKVPENLESYPNIQIMQGYLSFEPEKRIRASKQDGKTTYYLTEKGDGTIERTENEQEISGEKFNDYLSRIDATSLVRKTRYQIPLEESEHPLTLELDMYKNPELNEFAGKGSGMLRTAEVEFHGEGEEARFRDLLAKKDGVLSCLGKDVTEDKSFKNKNLAKFIGKQHDQQR